MTDVDPYINEIFESLDKRDSGKRIRIVGAAQPTMFRSGGYHYRRVNEFGEFAGMANRVHISAATLDTKYRKASR